MIEIVANRCQILEFVRSVGNQKHGNFSTCPAVEFSVPANVTVVFIRLFCCLWETKHFLQCC